MAVEWIVDASIVAAALFNEQHSAEARSFLADAIASGSLLCAPDLMVLEVASIAAKKAWCGDTSEADGASAVAVALRLTERPIRDSDLTLRAYTLASAHRFSAYDATYLALAELRRCRVATLDRRLTGRAETEGFGDLVHAVA